MKFDLICKKHHLGEMTGEPVVISGGLLHRMAALETTKGKYAVKLLNPEIMKRPEAMRNYIISESIARRAAMEVPALPAKTAEGSAIQQAGDQFYLVFDWSEGKSLRLNEIEPIHCGKLGTILALIHKTDFFALDISDEVAQHRELVDWAFYLNEGQKTGAEWVDLLAQNIGALHEWNKQSNEADEKLASNKVISHRDLDPKNVMWTAGNPVLIDWEAAGYINPMQDLAETAVYWSECEQAGIDGARFKAFLEGYEVSAGRVAADWQIVLAAGFKSRLEWLEYNLKRSLWIECQDKTEQELGTKQVMSTIDEINRYAKVIPELIDML